MWDAPGVFDILPGAESFLPQPTLDLVALANGKSMNHPVEEPEPTIT